VDDDGSLANYVAVPILATTPPLLSPVSPPPLPPPTANTKVPVPGQSFWSNSSSTSGVDGSYHQQQRPQQQSRTWSEGKSLWTSRYPPQLIAAAREEEAYLASSSHAGPGAAHGVPAPNIPPAPTLPRHLDKLILNVRPGAVPGSPGSLSAIAAIRSREREDRRGRRGRTQTVLGMTAVDGPSAKLAIPPATTAPGRTLHDGPALADDNSVLPVPSHVVLHHLSTSAIRNGMLAVANTTRYRKKVSVVVCGIVGD
jgi:hypothetical protein